MRNFDVVVIGLGAFGSATLFNLSKSGAKVIGIEQFEPGHDRGSSHGESRVIRLSYYENPGYVPLLREAYKRWENLDEGATAKVLTRTGILEAGVPDSKLVAGSFQASQEHGLTHERLTGHDISRLFPAFDVPDHWTGLYQADGGFLRPEMAIRRFISFAERNGATVCTHTRVTGLESQEAGILIRAAHELICAQSVVITAGAWSAGLHAGVDTPRRITEQTLAWYEPIQPQDYEIGRCPVFILDAGRERPTSTSANVCYGFPNFNGTGVKIASHAEGPILENPETRAENHTPIEDPHVREMLEDHLPGANGRCLRVKTCLYTNTDDGHFLIDRSTDDQRIIVASPCSGHGFKFASIIGEYLCDMALRRPLAFDLGGFSRETIKRWPQRPPID